MVATGIQIRWHKIPTLKESVGKNGVCSNHSHETVESTWEVIHYNGYTSCPLVMGIGRFVLAGFDSGKQPARTFPIDQSRERWSMWLLKRYLLPALYWRGMLNGPI